MSNSSLVRVGDSAADALADGRPVVALESTIFSSLGLPAPHNLDCLTRCVAAIESFGAVAAVTAVVDGVPVVGLSESETERVLAGTKKTSARDVAVAVGQKWDVGVTTVAASVMLAGLAGIEVFSTGGIGGVHRGSEISGDVSADLCAIAAHPVLTVTAGAKAFLDLARTVEYLDTLGVPLLGFGTDEFPAFYSRSSGVSVPHRVDDAAECAAVVTAARGLGYRGGIVLANPIPTSDEIPADDIEPVIESALAAAAAADVTGAGVTPYILEAIARSTAGRSIPANLALAENNARVAAEVAVSLVHS